MGDFILPMKISTYNNLTETSTTTTIITNTFTNPFKRTKSLKMVFSKQKDTMQNLLNRVIRSLLTVTVSTSSSSDGSLCRRCQGVIVVVKDEETNYRDVFSDEEKVIKQVVSSLRHLFFDGEREEVFWNKKILMGRRCRPLDFEEEEEEEEEVEEEET